MTKSRYDGLSIDKEELYKVALRFTYLAVNKNDSPIVSYQTMGVIATLVDNIHLHGRG